MVSKYNSFSDNKVYSLIWGPIFIFYFCVLSVSETVWNFGDGEMHYLISKFSFEQPLLLLDHWGKPLFTLLTSPFAQFGRKGIVLFNIFLISLIAFFNYKTLTQFKIKFAWIVLVIIGTSPLYFENVFSGLTETLFAALFSAGIYFIAKKQFIVAAIILSFTPLSRSEGLFLLPLVFLFYVWFKQYKSVIFLLTGFFIYSLVGFFVLDDFWWIFNKNPYNAPDGIYGSGNIFHFILSYKKVWGLYCFFLIIGATVLFVFQLIKNTLTFQNKVLLFAFLSFWMVLSIHSILWWKGIRGSAGLIRVLVATLSGSLLLVPSVFDFLAQKNKLVAKILATIFSIIFIFTLLKAKKLPIKATETYQIQKDASKWYKNSEYYTKRLIVSDVVLRSLSEKNPFDPNQISLPYFLNKTQPAKGLQSGELIAFEDWFFPVDASLKLKDFKENPCFDIEAVFTADSTELRSGELFEIYFFKRNNLPVPREQ